MKQEKGKGQKKRRDCFTTALLLCLFLVGLALLVYPSLSNWWNEQVSTKAVATYDETVSELSETDYSDYLEAAEAYNENLASIGSASAIANPGLVDEDYWDLLNISGTGVMGYVTIEKINVQLPIYHGTDASVLQVGAGHLEGTSLPVGGESTHCVISAHRGLPSALLFTNLDQMEIGDTFTITVLDQVLTYEVDQISIVLPTELENLYIEEGKDYCTLMTCTPYGVNSHRLLVRGVRVETVEKKLIYVTADAYKVSPLLAAPAFAVPLLAVMLLWLLFGPAKSKKEKKKQKKEQRKIQRKSRRRREKVLEPDEYWEE